MSSGQRPRRREYFPRMKQRGKHRPRRARVIVYDSQWRPVWPQPDWHNTRVGEPWYVVNHIDDIRHIRVGVKLAVPPPERPER